MARRSNKTRFFLRARRGRRSDRAGVLAISFLLTVGFVTTAGGQRLDWRDRGNRFEGTVEVPVSQTDLELVSFTGYRENTDGAPELTVRFYSPQGGEAIVRAREFQDEFHYLMESKPIATAPSSWSEFSPWPLAEVLGRLGLGFDDVGVVIEFRSPSGLDEYLAPAFVYANSPPDTIDRYELVFRPNIPLRDVDYAAFLEDSGDQDPAPIASGSLASEQSRGVPFAVNLDLSEVAAGVIRLEVGGRYANRLGGPEREYFFYHKP